MQARQTQQAFLQACAQAKHPLALAGAGLSAASGIPTFRGPGGLWRHHDPLSLATPDAFAADPSKVWQFYHYRREVCLSARPNAAHETLAWLATNDARREVWHSATKPFRLITQNVDGLSKRANDAVVADAAAPSATATSRRPIEDPLEMHGSLFRTTCVSCNATEWNFDSPICAGLAGTEDLSRDLSDLPLDALPRCKKPNCGGLLRPAVVWFGESIPLLSEIGPLVERCDLLLVLGTSSTVYPAAGFASQVRAQGGKVAVFNLDVQGQDEADFFFVGEADRTLPAAISRRPN